MKRQRVLLTSFDYAPRVGGVATCTGELASALARSGKAEVKLLVPKRRDPDPESPVETRWLRLPVTALLAVPRLALSLRREIRSWRPDAVIAMLWMPDGLALAASRKSVPYFVFAHGVELLESKSSWKKKLRAKLSFMKRRAFGNANGVFAVSGYTAGLVVKETGVSRDRIEIVHNGVDLRRFSPQEKSTDLVSKYSLQGKRVFLTVARLVPHKGIDTALKAFKRLHDSDPSKPWSYLICGSGTQENELRRLATDLGLQSRAIFAGPVPDGELSKYYNLCDCFVLLSREDLSAPNVEGFGIVFLEAAACGKPSLAGRSGGIPDAVVDGQTGWLVDPLDIEEIARQAAAIVDDSREAERRGASARERVVTDFTWDRVAEKVLRKIAEAS